MDNNPLRQYFRRPAVYISLPSKGADYEEGVVDIPETGELPIYPMTAIDEITARTPDALFNGTAVVELIKSCIPNIKDPWKITSNDLDAVLIGIKAASNGEQLDIESVCPACGESSNYGINLVAMLATLESGDYSKLYETGSLKIKFRPLTYKEMSDAAMIQFELQRTFTNISQEEDEKKREEMGKEALEKITLLTMEILTKAIDYIETPNGAVADPAFILDFLKNCDRNIYTGVRDANAELKSATEIKPLDVECPHCKHKYTQTVSLDPSDFFD